MRRTLTKSRTSEFRRTRYGLRTLSYRTCRCDHSIKETLLCQLNIVQTAVIHSDGMRKGVRTWIRLCTPLERLFSKKSCGRSSSWSYLAMETCGGCSVSPTALPRPRALKYILRFWLENTYSRPKIRFWTDSTTWHWPTAFEFQSRASCDRGPFISTYQSHMGVSRFRRQSWNKWTDRRTGPTALRIG